MIKRRQINKILKSAFSSILRNRMRSLLTSIGIIIGVSAVIIMSAIGRGSQALIEKEINDLGTNLLIIFPGASMTGGKIIVSGAVDELMPTFTVNAVKKKVKVDDTFKAEGPFYVFLGDLAEHGTGKLFVSKPANPQLSTIYDKYL